MKCILIVVQTIEENNDCVVELYWSVQNGLELNGNLLLDWGKISSAFLYVEQSPFPMQCAIGCLAVEIVPSSQHQHCTFRIFRSYPE